MAFDITIHCDTLEAAERVLACLRHDNAPAAAQVARQVNPPVEPGKDNPEVAPQTGNAELMKQAPPKKRGRPRREVAPPLTATESAAPTAPQGEPSGSAEPPAQRTYTIDDAKAALKKLLDKHNGDMGPALQVLGQFDAERITAVKEADYRAFVAACAAA